MAAGITPPYPNFTIRPCRESRRCPIAAAVSAVRDRQYHRQRWRQDRAVEFHAVVRGEADAAGVEGLPVPGRRLLTEADDRRRYLQRQQPADGYRAAWARYSIGLFDQAHSVKLSTVYECSSARGPRWLQDGVLSHVLGGWRLAAIAILRQWAADGATTSAPPPIFDGTNRPQPARALRLARAHRGRRIRTARRPLFNRAAFVQPVG